MLKLKKCFSQVEIVKFTRHKSSLLSHHTTTLMILSHTGISLVKLSISGTLNTHETTVFTIKSLMRFAVVFDSE